MIEGRLPWLLLALPGFNDRGCSVTPIFLSLPIFYIVFNKKMKKFSEILFF